MGNSFHAQESSTHKAPTAFWAGLSILVSLINWLASLIRFTEEELQEAGIYLDRPGGE